MERIFRHASRIFGYGGQVSHISELAICSNKGAKAYAFVYKFCSNKGAKAYAFVYKLLKRLRADLTIPVRYLKQKNGILKTNKVVY